MSEPAPEKAVVQSFYEDVGWLEDDASHQYLDALLFEDLRRVTSGYRASANRRVQSALCRDGDLLLDVASGPIQYDDYLRFSRGYRKRVCVDLSMRALVGARRRVGDDGLYVQADITALPFKNDAFDGIVSLHTIYHVPEAEQTNAVKELERTLRPGRRAAIVYKWHPSLLKRIIAFPFNLMDAAKRMTLQVPGVRPVIKSARAIAGHRDETTLPQNHGESAVPSIYFYAYGPDWFRQQVASPFALELRCWRSLEVPLLRKIPANELGRRLLECVQYVEDCFPHLLGRIGSYPLIIITRDEEGATPAGARS